MCGSISETFVLLIILSLCKYYICLVLSFVIQLESRQLFSNVVLASLGPLHFFINFSISISTLTEGPAGVMIGITRNLQITLRENYDYNNIQSSDPCMWYISPFTYSLFNFSQQHFVCSCQCINLGQFLPKVF